MSVAESRQMFWVVLARFSSNKYEWIFERKILGRREGFEISWKNSSSFFFHFLVNFSFFSFCNCCNTMIKIDNHIVSTHKSSHLDMRCSKIFGYSSLSRSLLKLQISKISKTMNICIDNRSIIQQRSNNKFIRIERFERQLLLTETIINSFHFCCSNNPPLSRAKLILCD